MSKRIFFNTQKTTTVIQKGYIELDEDFTQVYKSFSSIAIKIDSGNSWKLLFWILSNASNQNGIEVSNRTHALFNKFLVEKGCIEISKSTYYRCITELSDSGAITKVGKGHYYLNPYIFWQDDKASRIKFIQNEMSDGGYVSTNPSKFLG